MGFIEIFKTYISNIGDGFSAKIGHVNALAKEALGTYIEVPISAAQILTMGTSVIELLPVLTGNQYYEYEGVLEKNGDGTFGQGTIDYIAIVGSSSYVGTLVDPTALSFSTTNPMVVSQFSSKNPVTGVSAGDAITYSASLNETLVLTTYAGANPASNTATFQVKIKYWVRTIGV